MNLQKSLALAHRSLRLDQRSTLLHLMRGGMALGMLVSLIWVIVTRASLGAPGKSLFQTLAVIDFGFITIMAVALFATAITEERQEGSLGLMRMAGLTPVSILLGKSFSLLLTVLSLLGIQIPFLMFANTLGGIHPAQIGLGFLALGAYTVLGYGVGICCSVVCQRGLSAARWTLAILLLSQFWPYILGLFGPTPGLASLWLVILEAASNNAVEFDHAALWVYPLLGVAIFVLGWAGFGSAERRAGRERAERTLFSSSNWGGETRVPVFSGAALMWKDYRLFVGGRRGLYLRFGIYLLIAGVLTISLRPWEGGARTQDYGIGLLLMVAAGSVLDLGSLAGRVFRDEIAWQTYTSLLLLPKSILQISYAKVMGCLMASVPGLPFLALGFIVLLFEPENALTGALGILALFALLTALLPLISLVSLYLQRGAFPIVIFGTGLLLAALFQVSYEIGQEGLLALVGIVLMLVCVSVSGLLHRRIIRRLNELAGCDF